MKWDFGTTAKNEASDGNTHLIEYSPLGLNRTYGVIININDGKNKQTKVHYEIEITCEEEITDKTYLFVVNKKQVFVNEKPASTMNEEFAEQCAQAYFPLKLVVNTNGEYESIFNFKEIKQRWHRIEKKLKQVYKNELYSSQINQRSLFFETVGQLNRVLLEKDWFIQLFFKSNLRGAKGVVSTLPIFVTGAILFKTNVIYKEHPKNTNKIIAQVKGVCIDDRTESDILKGNPPTEKKTSDVKGTLDFKYQLNSKGWIDSIVGDCKVVFASAKQRQVSLEVYNLKSKVPKTKFEEQQGIEKQEDKEKDELKGKQQKKIYSLFGKKFKLGKK